MRKYVKNSHNYQEAMENKRRRTEVNKAQLNRNKAKSEIYNLGVKKRKMEEKDFSAIISVDTEIAQLQKNI